METSWAAVTLRFVDPNTDPDFAETVVWPTAAVVMRPETPPSNEATEGTEENHVTIELTSLVEPSVNVPVAVNCWVVPRAMDELAGITAMDCSAAAKTLKDAVPEIEPLAAVTVTEPVAFAEARPLEFTVAIALSVVLQEAEEVRSWVDPSVKVPVAENCRVVPAGTVAVEGATLRDTSVAAFTVNELWPETPPRVALTLEFPTANEVESPAELTMATVRFEEAQAAVEVKSWVLPSL